MLKDYINELKNFNYYDKLAEDTYIDVKDDGLWKVAQIKNISRFSHRISIEVRYDGHPAKYNESFDFPSLQKHAPFRRYSLPYTGPYTARRQPPRSTLEAHKRYLDRLNTPNKLKPEWINQYIRGELFIFVDSITRAPETSQREQDVNQTLQFLVHFILRTASIFEGNLELLRELQKQNLFEPLLIYVHPRIALLYASIQILFNFHSILVKFEESKELETQLGLNVGKILRETMQKCGVEAYCGKLIDFKGLNGRTLPWSIKKEALILLNFLSASAFAFPITTDTREVTELLDYMQYFIAQNIIKKEEGLAKMVELIINLICGGNFEGRLRGLNELKRMLEYPSSSEMLTNELSSRKVINVLIDNNNFNSELFKRSILVFEFAFKQKFLSRQHLSQILTLHKDKHELDLKTFYSCVASIGSFLDQKTALDLFKEITSLPLEEHMITLVKEYTLAVINKNLTFKGNSSNEDEKLGVGFLWRLIVTENVGDTATQYRMIEAFAALLSNNYYYREVEKYFILAVRGIQQRKRIDTFFKIIHQTLKISPRVGRAIEAVEKQIKIVDSVINALKQQQEFSEKMLQNTFEFLEEVSHVSRQKISFSQIFELWSLKQCSKYLLKLLRKYRLKDQHSQHVSHQKIIYKQLEVPVLREIIDHILLSPVEMGGYQNISEELYQTADELLICYNHQTNAIVYNYKHTLRTRYPQKIYGLGFYIQIINHCANSLIVEKAIKRFIEFYLRLTSEINRSLAQDVNSKIALWSKVLGDLSVLKANMLQAYLIFLEELKGRMKSLTILDADSHSILVLNRSTGKSKSITMPKYTSLWKFRHLISEQLELKQTNFEVIFRQDQNKMNFEKEEDFSSVFIPIMKDSYSVYVIPSKQMHPHHIALDKFHALMADTIGEQLEALLQVEEYVADIHRVLGALPFIKKTFSCIQKLRFNEKDDIFDSKCMGRLSYQLQIVNKVKSPPFVQLLLQKGFLQHISKIFINERNFRNYPVLSDLMNFCVEITKFIKVAKNCTIPFQEKYIMELMHWNPHPDYPLYISKCFALLRLLASQGHKHVGVAMKTKHIQEILESVLFTNLKEKVSDNISALCSITGTVPLLTKCLNKAMRIELLVQRQIQCKPFFDIVIALVSSKEDDDFITSLQKIMRLIRKSDIEEQSEEKPNQLLQGFLEILNVYAKSGKDIADLLGESLEDFLHFLVSPCLFNVENPNRIKFKSPTLRKLSLFLLSELKADSHSLSKMSNIIITFMRTGAWRKPDDWNISPIKLVQKTFTGLINLAATCYINSLLQQLYFIEKFSSQIIQLDATKIEDAENIVLELQKIFGHLMFSENSSYKTQSLCKTFILDGAPIDPRIQTDVDQFFHSLMDKLERNLTKIGRKQIINEVFGGQFSNLVVGQECSHASERIEHFLSIRLEIKNKTSLEAALQQFIKGEVLEGENAYFCERCDKKVKATKRVCLKTMPEVLIFNFDTMEKFKLNSFCSFPESMNFLPYTRNAIENDPDLDPANFQYRLKGVIIHYGISEAGHYTSYVRTDPEKWYYFDDDKITKFDRTELKDQCFGGLEENPFGDDEEKKKNAYLLFYEKVKQAPLQRIDLKKTHVHQQIEAENTRNKLVNILFEPNLENYIYSRSEIDSKTYLLYFHTVFLRSSNNLLKLHEFYLRAQELIKSKEVAAWYLQQINYHFVLQFLIHSDFKGRSLIVALILEAVRWSPPDLQFLKQLVFFVNQKGIYPMVKVFAFATKKDEVYRKYLSSINFGEIIMNIIRNKDGKAVNIPIIEPKKSANDFGTPNCTFTDKVVFDYYNIFQAVQNLKVAITVEEISFYIKKIKKMRTLDSIALIAARKFSEIEAFYKFVETFLEPNLVESQWSTEEQHCFSFMLKLVEQFAANNDQAGPKRIAKLAQIYMIALEKSLTGYRAEMLLLNGLFKICHRNAAFQEQMSELFQEKEGKRVLKMIKEWVKELPNAQQLIKLNKWGYWRKVKTSYGTNFLPEQDWSVDVNAYHASLNSIVEKHGKAVQFDEEKTIWPGQSVKLMENYSYEPYKVTKFYGLLAEIKHETTDKLKTVLAEELVPVDLN